jgi:multidrug resistance efflux pump
MDRPRTNPKKKRGPLYVGAGVVAIAGLTLGLSQLKPALPSVDRAAIWPDSVRRGPMVRSVRGPGTLTPEDIRIIPAITAGRVEQIYHRPGIRVEPGTLLLKLSNPDVELQLLESERQYTAAQSELVNLQSSLQTQILNQEAIIATLQTQYNDALRQAKTNEQLAARNLIAANEVSLAKDRAAELEKRLEIEKKALELLRGTVDVRVEAQRLQVERLRGIVAFRNQQLASMDVKAGSEGVLQQLNLEVGQWVNPGIELARVVQPGRLKAVLRIPETQMRDVVIGQRALIDTRNDTIEGRVVRIDPAAQNGTIGVDVAFDGALPPSARPDMSVDGTIELDRLNDVLYVGRPNFGAAGATIGLFKVSKDGKTAERVQVRLGQTSVNHVEIVSGLQQGDVVILSDMSQWDAHPRVRISN